jgi:hypothetical protein
MTSGYRLFDDLSREEAKALLDDYVAGLPLRVAALLDEVRRAGGPVDHLDFSRASMRPLWIWFLAAHRLPEGPIPDEVMRRADPPWWYDFHPPLGQQLGPELARLVTSLAAYMAQSVTSAYPDATWVLGPNKRMANYNMPLLHIPGRGESTLDSNFITLGFRGLNGDVLAADPGRLERLYDWWVLEATVVEGPPPPAYSVGAIEGGRLPGFTHVITFDDVIAHEQEVRVEALVDLLAQQPGVERAVQEDREIILLLAPDLATAELEATVARVWEATGSKG